jgi:uncharacterized protein
MLVVCDTTAITNLAAIKQLGLLRALYTEIVISEAVERELIEPGTSNPGAIEVQTESWILVRPVTDRSLMHNFSANTRPLMPVRPKRLL